eukprot:g6345.t1
MLRVLSLDGATVAALPCSAASPKKGHELRTEVRRMRGESRWEAFDLVFQGRLLPDSGVIDSGDLEVFAVWRPHPKVLTSSGERVTIFDYSGEEIHQIGPIRQLVGALFSADGGLFMALKADGRCMVYETDTGLELCSFSAAPRQAPIAAFSLHGLVALPAAGRSGAAQIFRARTGEHVSLCSGFAASTAPARKCIFSPDGTELLKISQDEPHRASTLRATAPVADAVLAPTERSLLLVLTDCTGRLYHKEEGQFVASRSLSALGFYISPYPVAFSSDGGRILLALDTCDVKILDAETGEAICECRGGKHHITSAAFSPDGSRVLVSYYHSDKKHQSKFGISIASQRCYAKRHGYHFEVIDPVEYRSCAKFRDFFFRKHCSVARFLEKQQDDYILCPGLEHWLVEVSATDVVLYERWMNNEIMAGNYAVRNSQFGIDFLDGWAAFEEELPKSGYHSSDNGAIHLHLLRALGLRNEKPCTQHWSHLGSDKNFMDEYYAFVSCTRLVMGAPRRWKIAGTPRDLEEEGGKVSSVGAISHHGQKTEVNYRQYFQDDFMKSGGTNCEAMIRDGFFVDADAYGQSLWEKLKARTEGALLDWTRQHAPPWDFLYLTCMKSLSCRPLDDEEELPVLFPRPLQSRLPYVRVPKGVSFEPCAGECQSLMDHSGDPFREVQAAALCQRLGLLKQTVDFGGSSQVVHFDPGLLDKAQRVLHMETYAEVREMARVLLKNFNSLCQVLMHLNDDQVKLELKENAEFTAALLRLEQDRDVGRPAELAEDWPGPLEVWADCQFILHQGCLDFIEILEQEVLPQLSPQLKWQIHLALEMENPGKPADPTD